VLESRLLQGCCDIHLHVAPSLIPRSADIVTVARQAEAAGYRAIVIKDHHYNSAPACDQIQRYLFNGSPLRIFGSIALNNSVGGVNPYVVEAAINFGVKIVWLPTVSARQHMEFHKAGGAFPSTRVALQERPITLTDEKGDLKQEVRDVIHLGAQAPDVVLATGHANAAEIEKVVEEAVSSGVKKILVDHPTFGLGANLEQVKCWASLGCWIEHCGTISAPEMGEKGTAISAIADYIREIGVDHTILSSDYGQAKFGNCIEGMSRYLQALANTGFTQEEIHKMSGENPGKLLSL